MWIFGNVNTQCDWDLAIEKDLTCRPGENSDGPQIKEVREADVHLVNTSLDVYNQSASITLYRFDVPVSKCVL